MVIMSPFFTSVQKKALLTLQLSQISLTWELRLFFLEDIQRSSRCELRSHTYSVRARSSEIRADRGVTLPL